MKVSLSVCCSVSAKTEPVVQAAVSQVFEQIITRRRVFCCFVIVASSEYHGDKNVSGHNVL